MVAQAGALAVIPVVEFPEDLTVAVPGILPGEGFSAVFKIKILPGIILQIAGLQAGAAQGDPAANFSPGAVEGAPRVRRPA